MSDLQMGTTAGTVMTVAGAVLDTVATRVDVSDLRKRIEGRRRLVSVAWVDRGLARKEVLEALLLQELVDTPGLLDRDLGLRVRWMLGAQMAGTLTGEWAR